MADDENKLFLKELADVSPLVNDNHIDLPKKTKVADKYIQRQLAASSFNHPDQQNPLTEGEVPMLDPHSWLEYKNPGVQDGVYRKLRLGKYPLQSTLDLHRKTIRQSRKLVWQFIQQSIQQNFRAVLITHGKGELSDPPAKVKSYVAHWLRQIPAVLAFHTAQRHHGSYGAVYVLLKKSEKNKEQTREQLTKRRSS